MARNRGGLTRSWKWSLANSDQVDDLATLIDLLLHNHG